jgi:ATP-binding cassette subfamily C protein
MVSSQPLQLRSGENARFEIGSSTPFLLDEPEKVWLIESGQVDVFVVQLQDGRAAGPRYHLFRAAAGDALFGISLMHREIGLLVVGAAGTWVAVLARASVEVLARNPDYNANVTALLNSWTAGLSAGLSQNIPSPRQFELLEPGKDMMLEPGAVARPRRGIAWVCAPEGLARFMGWEELPLIGEDDFLPIAQTTWLQSVNSNTLRALDTSTFLQQPFAWVCVENFHRMALDIITWNIQKALLAERERLKAKTAHNQASMRGAVHRLTSILMPERGLTGEYEDEEPLVAACRLVGTASGISIRRRPDPVDGQSEAQTLENIADASRIRVRRVALRGDWWRADNGPLLGYLEEGERPIALLPASPSRYTLYNTAGTQTPVTAEVAASLMPFAYSFYRPFPDRPVRGRDVLRFGLYGLRRDLTTLLLMGVAIGILGVLPPLVLRALFDSIIPGAERGVLAQLAGILVASAVGVALFQITRSVAVLRIESRLDASLQAAMWDRLLKLSAPFFRAYTAGDLNARVMGISTIRQAISGSIVLSVLSGVFSVFNFILLFFISDRLAMLAAGLVVAAVFATLGAGIMQTRHQRALVHLQGTLSGLVLQIITGIAKLRIAGAEARVFAFWAKDFGEQRSRGFRARRIANDLTVFNAAYPVLTFLVLFAIVGYGNITLSDGAFVAFLAAFNQFLYAGLQLSGAFITALRLVPVYERARPILQAVPEVNESKADPGNLSGDIEVSHVTFRYRERGPVVLQDVSLHVRRGEFVAIVGPSGSGKSSLLRLLVGFEQPETGSIFYDGRNLNGLDIRLVRRQLGVALQNSQLMAGDILTNIVGQANLTIDDAWEAARMAGFDEDIRKMPMGMHTFISAGSGTLSGGQRQRLLIARAIARRPRILLFDEATSSLDNETQAVVSRSLEALDATRMVVAHRLSTILHADRIVVMEKGRIVQQGTFSQLMGQPDDLFAELARRQLD